MLPQELALSLSTAPDIRVYPVAAAACRSNGEGSYPILGIDLRRDWVQVDCTVERRRATSILQLRVGSKAETRVRQCFH